MQTTKVTLITTPSEGAEILWSRAAAMSRLLFFDTIAELRFSIDFAEGAMGFDAERVIVERGNADDFLSLLAQIPFTFQGDVVLIRDDRSGYLSAVGRGGDRILYVMTAEDVSFYLEVSELVNKHWFGSEKLSALTQAPSDSAGLHSRSR